MITLIKNTYIWGIYTARLYNYLQQIRRTYPETRAKYEYIQDKRTLRELLTIDLTEICNYFICQRKS